MIRSSRKLFNKRVPLRFDDGVGAYAHLSTLHLARAVVVLRICAVPFIVQRADTLLNASRRILGTTITQAALRATFFGHFCAGETVEETRVVVEKLQAAGVGAIMDYAAEADVPLDPVAAIHDKMLHRTDSVHSARVYMYEGENECEANKELFLESICNAASAGEGQFVAIKLTALAKPELLEKMSSVLRAIKELWINEFGNTVEANKVDFDKFSSFIGSIGVKMTVDEQRQLFAELDTNHDNKIDYIEWSRLLSTQSLLTRRFFLEEGYDIKILRPMASRAATYFAHLLPLLRGEEVEVLDRAAARLDQVTALAAEKGVRLMIDAEQTYMQPAIDHLVRRQQEVHNKKAPIIFNTYQAYLKSARGHVRADLERSRRLGFCFAGKLVRGAYMVGERRRASDLGTASPICETIRDTHENYNACVDLVLRSRSGPDEAQLVVASHNQESIEKTVALIDDLGIDRRTGGVYFGQLLGMSDFLTFPLGLSGYRVFKYVPYGPIDEVVPYLVRRAQENSNALSNAPAERKMLFNELKRRLFQRK